MRTLAIGAAVTAGAALLTLVSMPGRRNAELIGAIGRAEAARLHDAVELARIMSGEQEWPPPTD